MPANYVLLERIELNASAASITFANIPQTGYTDLKVEMSVRTSLATGSWSNSFIQFNNSTTGYSDRAVAGNGASAISFSGAGYGTSVFTGDIPMANNTANTFSSQTIYIPNYAGSTNKSVSIDSVQETNATTAYAELIAGLWSNTAAINSIKFLLNGGESFVANSTFSLYGLAAVGTTPVIAPKASGGNRIDYDGTYWIHTFLTSGTFTPSTSLSCDYLVVAGGGGGGVTGGGGGAGGLRSTVTATGGGGSLESALSVASGTAYTVTIGAGGTAGVSGTPVGTNGSNSVFSTITSTGGGYGGSAFAPINGASGGSGGGSGQSSGTAGTGGAGTANQGRAGGNNFQGGTDGGGGGGGASVVGANGTTGGGGNGGNGVATSITGSSVTYAGGGGGGSTSGTLTTGGTGGGGAGANGGTVGTAGTVNTGGGGGASGFPALSGGAGGSGIVIIRYLAA
jgi:hypothetical protein